MRPCTRWALTAVLLSTLPLGAAAQGTWMQTQCLAAAGSPGPCKAAPAWGQTGLDHVQALAAAAGPGNLGQSLTKPETLPAGNAARAQVAAVMLGFLDSDRPSGTYRWFGPVAAPTAPRPGAQAATANPNAGPAAQPGAATAMAPAPGGTTTATGTPTSANGSSSAASSPITSAAGNSPAPTVPAQATWLAGALGEDPQSRSASWWLAGTFAGPGAPPEANASADRYRVLRFLAAQCPQLEGKVAPNAWTRCTTRSVPEPGTVGLVLLALLLAGGAGAFSARWPMAPKARLQAWWKPRGARPPN